MHAAGITPAVGRLLVFLVSSMSAVAAHAIVVPLDVLTVTKNAITFTDSFENGVPPPSGPLGGSTYATQGSFAGAEAGSRLVFDSSRGNSVDNAAGAARLLHGIILLTSTTNAANGLWVTDNITMTGRFDFVTPAGPLINGYGLQLIDAPTGGTINQLVQLYVWYNPQTGGPEVGFVNQDFVTDSILAIDSAPFAPPPGADQIELRFARVLNQAGALTNQFSGSYSYLAGGDTLQTFTFDKLGTMFVGEDFVRARVFAAEAIVPEPSSYALMLAGLAGLGWMARRRSS